MCTVWLQAAPDVIKRWVNEVQTALTTKTDMVQFHALALLRNIKQHDKQAVSKVCPPPTHTLHCTEVFTPSH